MSINLQEENQILRNQADVLGNMLEAFLKYRFNQINHALSNPGLTAEQVNQLNKERQNVIAQLQQIGEFAQVRKELQNPNKANEIDYAGKFR